MHIKEKVVDISRDFLNSNGAPKYAKIKKIIGILLVLVLIALTGAVIVFRNEIRTIASLKKIDDYGMY